MSKNPLWELFHENSKLSPYDVPPATSAILEKIGGLFEVLPFLDDKGLVLPDMVDDLQVSLRDAMCGRESLRRFHLRTMTLPELGSILRMACGVNRMNDDPGVFNFRAAPSAGALYPLEVFVYADNVQDLSTGLYHYNPLSFQMSCCVNGDLSDELRSALVDGRVVEDQSVMIFLVAFFEKTIFKYGDRGYRFILLEAGHIAQNLNLAATALGFGTLNIGGFYDRSMDELLRVDGVSSSALYLTAIGGKADSTTRGESFSNDAG